MKSSRHCFNFSVWTGGSFVSTLASLLRFSLVLPHLITCSPFTSSFLLFDSIPPTYSFLQSQDNCPKIRPGIIWTGIRKLECQGDKWVGPTKAMGKRPSCQDLDGPVCRASGHGGRPWCTTARNAQSRKREHEKGQDGGSPTFLTPTQRKSLWQEEGPVTKNVQVPLPTDPQGVLSGFLPQTPPHINR